MKTLGEQRVDYAFNPSGESVTQEIKKKSAELIDLINSIIEPQERSEKARSVNIAINKIEEGCMHAIKGFFK